MSDTTIPPAWETARATDQFVPGGNVEGKDLSGADLTDIRLEEPAADRVDLRKAVLEDFRSMGGSFVEARFDGAFLASAMFFDAVMARARFDAVRGEDVSFATCILRGASFVGAELAGADLLGCDLSGSDLTDASLSRATAKQASFRDAKLTNAELDGADLTKADFRGAELTGVRWDGATLDDAHFDPGADPRG